jgi:RimJ/RimL family protein N-acetyltransferase
LHLPARAELERRPLKTARLALTPLDADDARDFFRAVDESRAHLRAGLDWVDVCAAPSDAHQRCAASPEDWDSARALRLAVRESSTLTFLGVAALEALMPAHDCGDLVVWLRADCLRQGYATEAAAALLVFAFRRAGMHRVRAFAGPSNAGALGVLRKLGFRFEAVVRGVDPRGGQWIDQWQHALLARDPVSGPAWVDR